MAQDMETAFQTAIDAGGINGVIVSATDRAGNFVYNKAFGQRTLLSGEKKPQELDDVLYLASATKLLASIAALQCVEDGLLTLKGDVSSIVPEMVAQDVLKGFAEDGETPLVEKPVRPVTLEMLITHSAGTSYHFIDPTIGKWADKHNPPPPPGGRRPVEEAFANPLAYQPGEGWMYGPGLDWAGRIVERVTDLTLGEYMQKRIFDPLGISSGSFSPMDREDLRARMVDLNPDDPEGLGKAVVGGADMNRRALGHFGGQGMFLSGIDYVKILQSLLANDGKLLRPETVDDMFQDHLSPEAAKAHREALAGPMGVFFSVGVDREVKSSYGLGGMLTLEDTGGWYGERTLSWGGGLTFAWFVDRQNDLCGVVALLAPLPSEGSTMLDLKHAFRHDIYRKHAAWKETQAS